MDPIISISPLIAFVDPNMVEADGLVPTTTEFLRGARVGGFEIGQVLKAEDEDGQLYDASLERIDGDMLFLRLQAVQSLPQAASITFFPVTQHSSEAQAEAEVSFDPQPWVSVR